MAVGTSVRQRREKAVNQIAMCHVQLDRIEADAHRAPRRRHEGISHPRDIVGRHGAWGGP
jgi:hypothetical protein